MAYAIELYRQAYELDYRQGDWEMAETLYKRIIEEHPHSDEAEYARVHLDRIASLKGNPDMPEIRSSHGGGSGGAFGIISFVLVLFLCVAAGFLGYSLYLQHLRQVRTDHILHALLSERRGLTADALARYRSARVVMKEDAVGARYLAEFYFGREEYGLAAIELKLWEYAAPTDPAAAKFGRRLEKAKDGGGGAKGARR
jgi:tetratricopeptide (TPR) repeat protein